MELGRFVVNSTVGIGGFFDPATHIGLQARPEDFDQTLGVWGFGPGSYHVLPFVGPCSTREILAMPLDAIGDGAYGAGVLNAINTRALRDEEIEELRANALDWYVFIRNAYKQSREAAIRNGEIEKEEIPDDLYDLDEDELDDEE